MNTDLDRINEICNVAFALRSCIPPAAVVECSHCRTVSLRKLNRFVARVAAAFSSSVGVPSDITIALARSALSSSSPAWVASYKKAVAPKRMRREM